MIKIIKSGRDKEFFNRCPACATDYTYQSDDVERPETVSTADVRLYVPPVYVRCPVCGDKNPAAMLEQTDDNAWANTMIAAYRCLGTGFGGCPEPVKGEDGA